MWATRVSQRGQSPAQGVVLHLNLGCAGNAATGSRGIEKDLAVLITSGPVVSMAK
jgi:hypothetical protein